ncbi:unnamed protein product [Coregonus sp. 'balchen']|nr:unnamed protein product [Coregonus sp. 'balchen']
MMMMMMMMMMMRMCVCMCMLSVECVTYLTSDLFVFSQVAEQLMTIAYESGVNLFDTAEVYAAGKAEVILGNIIKKKSWR